MTTDQIIELVYRKDYGALRQALAQEVNSTDQDGRTPLMHAVLASDAAADTVRLLIEIGANPNAVDGGQKWTALHFAARDQKLSIVAALLEAGALVDAQDSFGNTPLWRCVMESKAQPNLVILLLKNGANPRKMNLSGVSPIDIAQRMGKAELSGLLEIGWSVEENGSQQ